MPPLDISSILPELILTVLVCLIFVIDLFTPKSKKSWVGLFALLGIIAALIATVSMTGSTKLSFTNSWSVDSYAAFFKIIFLLVSALTILISFKYLNIEEINSGEFYGLIIFATLGMMIMASGADLMVIYLGLELMSFSIYVLAGFLRKDQKSTEAALKYFLLGAFSSGILLYGMALVYGIAGSTNLMEIGKFSANSDILKNPVLILGTIFLVAGFGFKIAAVPFHMWTPDVYEGAPTSITAFMSVGPKAAAFAALGRIFILALAGSLPKWQILLWVLAAVTMTVGNVLAIAQTNIKRMLAYSSIAHAGYILIGFAVGNSVGTAAILLYILVYAFMNIGAFAMVILICRHGHRGDQITDFTGFAKKNPLAGLIFVIFFLSLAGIPPTGGFVAKFYLFAAAIEAKFLWLAIIGVLNSAVSLYYYFKVVMLMFMTEAEGEIPLSLSPALTLAIIIMVVATLLIGIYPGPFIEAAKASVLSLL